jgi:hypothetical protein
MCESELGREFGNASQTKLGFFMLVWMRAHSCSGVKIKLPSILLYGWSGSRNQTEMPNLGSQLPHQEVGCSETQSQDMRRAVVASDVLVTRGAMRTDDRGNTVCIKWTPPLNFDIVHFGWRS